MASLTSIRNGLKTRLDTIDKLQALAERVSNPTPPTAWVTPGDPVVEYDVTMGRGLDKWNMVIEIFVGLANDRGAQKRLDSFLASSGASSIKAAVEGDRTLAGVCDDLRVTRIDGYADYELGAKGAVIGCRAHIEIYAQGD